MTTVEVRTAYLVDPRINADKMYRTYATDEWIVVQYGPNGTSGYGNLSWRPVQGGGHGDAELMLRKKMLKGYHDLQVHSFEFTPLVDSTRHAQETLVNAYVAQQVSGHAPSAAATSVEVAAEPEVIADRFAEFTDRALRAISLSVTDKSRAVVELTLLNDQWEELERVHGKAASYMNTLQQMMTSTS